MRPGVGPALRQPLAEITHGRSYGAAIWIISGRALACQHTQRHSGFICLPQRFGSQRLAPYLRRIVIPSSPLFSRWIEHALGVAVKRPHDTDPRKHGRHARRAHFKGKGPARFRDEALKRRCKWFAITPSSGQRFEALGLNCQPITANRPAGAPTSAGFSHDCASARIVPIVLQPRLCFQKSGLVTSFGP